MLNVVRYVSFQPIYRYQIFKSSDIRIGTGLKKPISIRVEITLQVSVRKLKYRYSDGREQRCVAKMGEGGGDGGDPLGSGSTVM